MNINFLSDYLIVNCCNKDNALYVFFCPKIIARVTFYLYDFDYQLFSVLNKKIKMDSSSFKRQIRQKKNIGD